MRFLAVALFLWVPSIAADDEAIMFLRQISLRYLSRTSYAAKADLLMEETRGTYYSRSSAKVEIDWTTGRQRVDYIAPSATRSWRDGRDLPPSLVLPITIGSLPLFYDRLLRPQPFHQGETQHEPLIRIGEARFLGAETLQLGPRTVPCRVVEVQYMLPKETLTLKVWVDPSQHTIWKEVVTRPSLTRTITFQEISFDATIPPERFTRQVRQPKQTPSVVSAQLLGARAADAPPATATAHEATALLARSAKVYAGLQRWIEPASGLVLQWKNVETTVTYTSFEAKPEVRP